MSAILSAAIPFFQFALPGFNKTTTKLVPLRTFILYQNKMKEVMLRRCKKKLLTAQCGW